MKLFKVTENGCDMGRFSTKSEASLHGRTQEFCISDNGISYDVIEEKE